MAGSDAAETRVVVLLRAVNLGARNKVPMARLREVLTERGAGQVSTYIQSGNILCVPPVDADAFAREIEDAIAAEFGVTTTAVPRTPAELRAALAAYPFETDDPGLGAISFLGSVPDRALADDLSGRDFGGDACRVIGRDLHLTYARGVRASPMSPAVLTRALGGVEGTARNLRTVQKLVDLCTP